jgi:hypothetical protein
MTGKVVGGAAAEGSHKFFVRKWRERTLTRVTMSHAAEIEARFAAWLAEYGGIIHKITRAYAVRSGEEALAGVAGCSIVSSCKSK